MFSLQRRVSNPLQALCRIPGRSQLCHSIPRSDRTSNHVRDLAVRYPRTKFVSIVGNKCIADLPDSRIPMLIIYRKGEIRNQLVAWGADRERRVEGMSAFSMPLLLFTRLRRTRDNPDAVWSD